MQKIDITKIPSSTLADMFYLLKAQRADLSKQDKELKEKQEKIEAEFANRCIERGEDGLTVGNVRITRTIKKTAIVADGEEFLQWAQKNGRMDMVSVKHVAAPLKEFVSNEGQLPEGMTYLEKYAISITKA